MTLPYFFRHRELTFPFGGAMLANPLPDSQKYP